MSSQESVPNCKICYEVYNLKDRKPVSFMCGHGFCESCVNTIRNPTHTFRGSFKKFICPVCKDECSQIIYNRDLMDWIEHTDYHNPMVQTLEETLTNITDEIYKSTRKYASLEKEIKRLTREIDELHKGHHELFDQHFTEVKRKSQIEYEMILNDAKKNANRINNEAVEGMARMMNEIKHIDQHKHNFVMRYDDMINNLQEFKTLMKQLEITYPEGSKSAKKEVRKLIEQIIGWEISAFIKPTPK